MPLDRRHLQLDNLEVAYRESGPPTAPTLLLVHGLASSSRMWAETMTALSPAFRCVALDLPGHGGSSAPEFSWYNVENYAAVLERFRRELSLRPVGLVGHSMGTMVLMHAMSSAQLEPGRLVLVAPFYEGSRLRYRQRVRTLTQRPWLSLCLALWRTGVRLYGSIPSGWLPGPAGTIRSKQQDLLELDPNSALGSLRALVNTDLSLGTRLRGTPTLLLVGKRDRTGALAQARRLDDHHSATQLVELPARHHPFYETPQEYFACLEGFLEIVEVV